MVAYCCFLRLQGGRRGGGGSCLRFKGLRGGGGVYNIGAEKY